MSANGSNGEEAALLTLICSGNGLKEQITFDLRNSLNDLKDELVRSAKLGKFDAGELRLFYLGRELKNGGRSLESLGVGLHDVTVIHVHPAKSASATWKAAPLPPRSAAAAPTGMARFLQPLPGGAMSAIAFGRAPTSFASFLRQSALSSSAGDGNNNNNNTSGGEVIEIGEEEEEEVGVSDGATATSGETPASNATDLLASLRTAMNHHAAAAAAAASSSRHNNNSEIVNVDDGDDDGDECVVVGTLSARAAKRRRHE
uniref:Ubiquitin-like domain-containing protein n=1 Tax=Amphora coffeiformis TaxID=265554 RepID=A0A7S3L782_9STRA